MHSRRFLRACLWLGVAIAARPALSQDDLVPPKEAVHEIKDASGRVLRRVVFQADGGLQIDSYVYQGAVLRQREEDRLDSARVSLRKVRETFDEQARLVEREETSERTGRKVGTLTRLRYDGKGRKVEEKTPIE